MSEIKIEKGVAMPRSGYWNSKYPWDTMEVGDSFVAQGKGNGYMLAASASNSRPGKKFKAKRMPDKTTRIWRTA